MQNQEELIESIGTGIAIISQKTYSEMRIGNCETLLRLLNLHK